MLIDLLLKNNGVNISIVVGIFIEKWMFIWPSFFPHKKLPRDEGMKLETAFWEMLFVTDECIEVYDFLKLYFRMCTNLNIYVPFRPWFGDEDEEQQWECGFRDNMIAHVKQDLYNKNFDLQDQGKDDPIDIFQKRN